jgi:flagellar biosynthesis protein FliQ
MSINQLHIDLEEHFLLFERVPFKAALRRRDARSCLVWIVACLIALLWALVEVPGITLSHYIPILLPILLITMICAAHIGEVYSQIRAEGLGAGPNTSRTERLRLQQEWLCKRYECCPSELLDRARDLRHKWEERQEIRRLASNDTMGPRFAAFFRLPDPARFIGFLVAIVAIVATLVTLGSSVDSIFEALQDWRTLGVNIVISTFLCTELVLLWIMATGMVREIGPSLLEQIGLLPLSSRRVYRYLLAIHIASEPINPESKKLAGFLKVISLFFVPIPELWNRARASIWARLRVGA